AARRAVAELRREGVLRLPGETIRSRGSFAAPRATPRVEGDLLRRRARRADTRPERLRSHRRASIALRGNRRRARARAATGRRLRDLPRRRPAREDRSRVDGALARGAGSVSRHGSDEPRTRIADPPQGARPAEESLVAEGGGAASARCDRSRQEARLLDSRGRLAARRARAVRARDAVAGDTAWPGFLPPGSREAHHRRPRRSSRRSESAAMGPARIHAVVRAPRRTNPNEPK